MWKLKPKTVVIFGFGCSNWLFDLNFFFCVVYRVKIQLLGCCIKHTAFVAFYHSDKIGDEELYSYTVTTWKTCYFESNKQTSFHRPEMVLPMSTLQNRELKIKTLNFRVVNFENGSNISDFIQNNTNFLWF